MNKQVFDIFENKVKFRGVACKNYHQGEFCILFQVNGVEFLIDGLKVEGKKVPVWDIKEASVYHYDSVDAKNEKTECPFCGYVYTNDKVMTEEMKCVHLNEQLYLEAIVGTCVNQEGFINVWNDLVEQMNPKRIEKIK